jgi:hypothetical protein
VSADGAVASILALSSSASADDIALATTREGGERERAERLA